MQIQHGVKFISETDTEVIVKLSQYIYDHSASKPTFPEVSIDPTLVPRLQHPLSAIKLVDLMDCAIRIASVLSSVDFGSLAGVEYFVH